MPDTMTHAQLVDLIAGVAATVNPADLVPDFDLMAAIAIAESGGNPLACNTKNKNGSIDRGLWQINSVHKNEFPELGDFRTACYSPRGNATMALLIWRQQGYKAWSVFNKLK